MKSPLKKRSKLMNLKKQLLNLLTLFKSQNMIKLKDQIELKLLKLHWCVTMQGTTAKLQDWILSQLSCMLKELTSLQSKTLLLLNFNSISKLQILITICSMLELSAFFLKRVTLHLDAMTISLLNLHLWKLSQAFYEQ